LHDVSSQKAIFFVTEHPYKPIIERNALLNDREDIMANWKNYTMRNLVIILREFNYAVADTSYRGADKSLARSGKETSYSDRRFCCSYILFIIIIGGILVLYIYIKTSIKGNILTIKQNTSGSRSG
jgi:hypothetical protein